MHRRSLFPQREERRLEKEMRDKEKRLSFNQKVRQTSHVK